MAKIRELRGNLFESTCQTLVNTVNCVGVMGKGIAFEYRHRFPDMYSTYKELCDLGRLRPGLLYLYKRASPWILCFPTKDHWKYPSKLPYVEAGLRKFADTYSEKGVTSIAFPQLGTSAGGLDWRDVREVMLKYLAPLPNLEVEIYSFDPHAKDSYFDTLYQVAHRFGVEDYKNYLGIPTRQARLLHDAFDAHEMHSMLEVQNIDGVGEKTFEKLYSFVNSLESKRVITDSERQPTLDL